MVVASPLRTISRAAKRFAKLLQALRISGNRFEKLVNLAIALRSSENTQNYIANLGTAPNFIRPTSWTEKMQWRKLFDRNPLLALFCDKIAVRDYVRRHAPEVAFPRFHWTGDDVTTIPFADLPASFVVKPNNQSAQVLIIKDFAPAMREDIIRFCTKCLALPPHGRAPYEWGYQKVKTRMIIEDYIPSPDPARLTASYKMLVFSGTVRLVQAETGTPDQQYLTFFSREGERLMIRKWRGYVPVEKMLPPEPGLRLPERFDEMIRIAERLGEEIDHVRVDLYRHDGRIYFSEMTAYDGSGYSYLYDETEAFEGRPPQKLNFELGAHWHLPELSTMQLLRGVISR